GSIFNLVRNKKQKSQSKPKSEVSVDDIVYIREKIYNLLNTNISHFEGINEKVPTEHFMAFSDYIFDITTSKYAKDPLNTEIFDLLEIIHFILDNNDNIEFVDVLKNIRECIITDLNKLYITKQNSDI